jgi:hypothetical protein
MGNVGETSEGTGSEATYTVCPGSVRTVFFKNTRRELFSKFHSFYSTWSPSESIHSWNRLKSFQKQVTVLLLWNCI